MKIYKVGGCVRDLVLGVTPKDTDWVIVGASKEDIQKLIGKEIPVTEDQPYHMRTASYIFSQSTKKKGSSDRKSVV